MGLLYRLKKVQKIFSVISEDFRSLSLSNALKRLRSRSKNAYLGFAALSAYPAKINDPRFANLGLQSKGLRNLLSKKKNWSILLEISSAEINSVRRIIWSALEQMIPGDELFIGHQKKLKKEIMELIELAKSEAKNKSLLCVDHYFPNSKLVLNELASLAKGEHLLLVEENGWLRPDLLYRYHQFILSKNLPQEVIIYCDDQKITASGELILETRLKKPSSFPFPFIFSNLISNFISVPASAWKKMGGLNPKYQKLSIFDLCLRLENSGHTLAGIPLPLYAQTEDNAKATPSSAIGQEILENYFEKKTYPSKFTTGMNDHVYRPLLKNDTQKGTIVIVPFHNQFEMTKQCLKQLNGFKATQKIHVIAVNNRSATNVNLDEIKKLSDQFLDADFEFNYSKINNFAVSQCSVNRNEYPFVMFLNNDVLLQAGALQEMTSWLKFNDIGIVGARLFYPNGLIQHAGIILDRDSSQKEMQWRYLDFKKSKSNHHLSSSILVTDAVTAACALMRRSDFEAIGGFDEIQYPIAYSDTNLCVRIRKQLGKFSLMTPYAEGIHHESLTRGKNAIEDYENSGWLVSFQDLDIKSVSARHE